MAQVTQTEAWKALQAHHEQLKNVHMRDLFKQDPKRFDKFNLRSWTIEMVTPDSGLTTLTVGSACVEREKRGR